MFNKGCINIINSTVLKPNELFFNFSEEEDGEGEEEEDEEDA